MNPIREHLKKMRRSNKKAIETMKRVNSLVIPILLEGHNGRDFHVKFFNSDHHWQISLGVRTADYWPGSGSWRPYKETATRVGEDTMFQWLTNS